MILVEVFLIVGHNNEAHFEISLNELEDRLNALNLDIRYYTPSVHKASFALPKYVENLIA